MTTAIHPANMPKPPANHPMMQAVAQKTAPVAATNLPIFFGSVAMPVQIAMQALEHRKPQQLM